MSCDSSEESPWFSRLSNGVIGLVAGLHIVGLLLCRMPPMIDYPQHLAMAATLHRLMTPGSPEHATFKTSLFTYNGGFEVLTAMLGSLMSIELAGRVVLAGYAALFVYAAYRLVQRAGRPRWYTLLVTPVIFGQVAGWGFANYLLSLPLVILTCSLWLEELDACAAGPSTFSARRWISIVLLSCATAYTHVLGMLAVCLIAMTAMVWSLWPDRENRDAGVWAPLKASFLASLKACLTLLPAVAYCIAAFVYARRTSTSTWEFSRRDGDDDTLLFKLRELPLLATGNLSGDWDRYAFVATVAIGAAVWFASRRRGVETRMAAIAKVLFAAYLILPKFVLSTAYIYFRCLPLFVVFAVAALPIVEGIVGRALAALTSTVALGISVLIARLLVTIPEVDDFFAVIDDAPPGGRLVGLNYSVKSQGVKREVWTHAPAYYQVRKGGEIAMSFLRHESTPVHYRRNKQPPMPPQGIEWAGRLYDPHAAWTAGYDLVLVRTASLSNDPITQVFKDDESRATLVSHHGRFWLYSVSAPSDVSGPPAQSVATHAMGPVFRLPPAMGPRYGASGRRPQPSPDPSSTDVERGAPPAPDDATVDMPTPKGTAM